MDNIAGSSDGVRNPLILENGGNLKAPKHIIPNVPAARTIYFRDRSESLRRIQLYAQIEGLIAGNPPYNPAELKKAGLGHIANFNTLDGRALYERGALAYWNLLNEAETIVKFELRGTDPQLLDWADTMARNWDYVVRKWKSFYTHVNTLAAQIVKFGISPVLWTDEKDWRWRTIELARFFVPDQTQSDIDMLTHVSVVSNFTAQYLYEVYDSIKDEVENSTPWNAKELEMLLLYRANTFAKQNNWGAFDSIYDLQIKVQNGDVTYDAVFNDSIQLVSTLYREYNGKITHYMYDPVYSYDTQKFLYQKDDLYNDMTEAIVIFTASPGEFTIHSNRGLGHKMFSAIQAMMQLDCSAVDGARMASTPLIKTVAGGAKDESQIRFYPGVATHIGSSEFVQNTIGENLEQVIKVSQYMLSKVQFNTANSGDDPGVPDANQGSISDGQARRQSFKEFGILKHNIAHFYAQFDTVVQNMTIKMLNSKKGYPGYEYAEEWKQRCLEDGVPPQIFEMPEDDFWGMPRHMKVRATRVAGDGSTLARIMGLQELMPIAADFGPKEAKEYKRQWVMATLGPEYVPAFVQPDMPDEAAGGASLAGLENNDMSNGQSPVFSADNEQRSHIMVHLALANHIINALTQQQMDPIQADKVYTVLIPHLGEHIQFLSKSPFAIAFMKSIIQPWQQVQRNATLNRKNAANMIEAQIRKQQELQQKIPQVQNEEQLKTMQVMNEEKRKDFQVTATVQRADKANNTRADIERDKIIRQTENQRLKINLEASNKAGAANVNELETTPLPELRQQLSNINGVTPSPTDIEGI